jgi:hypothetical protein
MLALPAATSSWWRLLTVTATGRAGNVATQPMPQASAHPPAFADAATIYYRAGSSGAYTVTALATDTLAGLDSLAFPEATAAGGAYPLNGAPTTTRFHPYLFDAGDTLSSTLAVTATDRAGNVTTRPFTLVRDAMAPTASIQVPTAAPLRFEVTWAGQDSLSGVQDYDVAYKVEGGDWLGWYTHTTQTASNFSGERDQSYAFRVRATD